MMVGLSLVGYVKLTLFMRRMTLLRLFTPSSAPGSGNTNRMLSFLISKYDFFSGYFSTNLGPQDSLRLPWAPHLQAPTLGQDAG